MLENYIQDDYVRFVVLLVLGFVILRVFIWIIEKVVVKLTVKTKSDLDDILIKKTSRPLTFLVFFIVLKFAVAELMLQESVQIVLDKIIFSFILIFIFAIAYRVFFLILNRSLTKNSRKSKKGNEGLFNLLEGTLKVILIIAGFLALLSYWNVEITPLLAGLGIGGIAIAFALQSSLANVFGGVAIILDKSVNVGDLVKLGDGTSGKIMMISLRSTRIKTFDNEMIIVPNSQLANGTIHNVAQPEPKSRVVVPFGVAYGSEIEKVKKIVLNEIKKIKGFVDNPEPSVKFLEMADSSLNFKAYFFVDTFENRFAAIDEANTRIYNALNKAKIEIPFPQMDVNLKK